MGHRQIFTPAHMFEIENDQSWNSTEQPYMHIARAGAAENSSLIYPMDNMSIDGPQYVSHYNPAPEPNGYSSLGHNVEIPHYQQDASGLSDLSLHPSPAAGFYMVPETYGHHASSSNYDGQTFHGVDGDFFDLNGRGQYKRKSPGIPAVCERDRTSRYNDAGSSSDISMSSDLWQEKPNMDFLHTPMNPSHRANNSLSIGGEGTLRNVRSRAALDLETSLSRTHLSNNVSREYYTTSRPMDVLHSVDSLRQSSHGSTREWNPSYMSPAVHDNSVLNHETNHFIVGSSNPSASLELGEPNNDLITRSNHVPQNFQGTSTQSVRGTRSSYIQRSAPTFRASSSSLRLGHAVAPDEGLQLATESYSSQHARPSSTVGWRTSDRNGRTRMSSERYRSFSEEASFRDRLGPEGLMIVDRSAFYGSRSLFDQHRDMRLDIDNMSYEELLALGERIGNVNTGLSEDLISKCLRESIYCSSDLIQEEGTCVICLEEYANMDDIGVLKACGHDFHVGCIRKWLSLKNLCPICKAPALGDPMNKK